MFRAKSVAGGLSVWAGMTGLRGTSTDSSIVDFNLAVTLLICVSMVAFFPNTQQIMSRFDPAYNWYEWRDVAPPLIPWTWRPNTVGLMLAGAVLFFGVVFIQ